MKLIHRFKSLAGLVGLIRNPLKTEYVFVLSDAGRAANPDLVQKAEQYLSSIDGVEDLYRERYVPALPKVTELKRLPENTFGAQFAGFISKNNLDVGFFPTSNQAQKIDYLSNRARYSHDQWHVLTGFEATIPGEIGLQAFTVAQLKVPTSAAIMVAALLHVILFKPSLFDESIEAMFKGYQMGKRTKPLLGLKLEDYWPRDLEGLRKDLQIA